MIQQLCYDVTFVI